MLLETLLEKKTYKATQRLAVMGENVFFASCGISLQRNLSGMHVC